MAARSAQAGVPRQRAAVLAGVDLAGPGRAARARLVGADADQGLGADAAQEEPAAAESGGDRAEGIRTAGRRAAKEPPKKTYDFYSVLPEMEVVIPGRRTVGQGDAPNSSASSSGGANAAGSTANPRNALHAARPPRPTPRYVLLAGSYAGAKAADEAKAKLALLGIRRKSAVDHDQRQDLAPRERRSLRERERNRGGQAIAGRQRRQRDRAEGSRRGQ